MQTGNLMFFDIYVPSLNIIFEYHGYQHYYYHHIFGDVKFPKGRDNERRLLCAKQNITYIEIPYWWPHDKESIIAIMCQVRPDIMLTLESLHLNKLQLLNN